MSCLATETSPSMIGVIQGHRLPVDESPVRHCWISRLGIAAYCVALLVFSSWFLGLHHRFPIEYHPDEPAKAAQVLSADGDRNFNHPLLLLEATQVMVRWLDTPRTSQATVEVGREVSAVFTAIAVTSLTLTGYLAAGWWGVAFVSLATLFCPFLIAHSRFMKEDAALCLGLSLVVLASRLYWDARRPLSLLMATTFLGFSCAVAMSGKYIGVIGLAMAVPTMLLSPSFIRQRRTIPLIGRFLVFAVATALTVAAINYRAIENYARFRESLDREIEHSLTEHRGIYMKTPTAYFTDMAMSQTPIVVLGFAALFAVQLLIWRRRSGWDYLLASFAILFGVVMSFCAIPVARYALPLVLLLFLLASLSAANLVGLVPERLARLRLAVGAVLVTLMFVTLFKPAMDCTCQFANDSRQQLRDWMFEHVPAGSLVAEDWYAGLTIPAYNGRDDGLTRQFNVRVQSFAPDVVSLDQLRANPGHYVVVCETSYDRWLQPYGIPVPEMKSRYDYNRSWYTKLFTSDAFELVWESEQNWRTQSMTNPQIKVYRAKAKGT